MTKKVLVIENDRLLNAVVQSMLEDLNDLDVVGCEASSQAELFGFIDSEKPDVVVGNSLMIENELPALLRHLQHFPKMRTILVSFYDNQLFVYDTQKFMLEQFADFIQLL